jgi:hypothetical protein
MVTNYPFRFFFFIIIILIFSSCQLWEDDSLELLNEFDLTFVDSIGIYIGKSTYTKGHLELEYNTLVSNSVLKTQLNLSTLTSIEKLISFITKHTIAIENNQSIYFNNLKKWEEVYNIDIFNNKYSIDSIHNYDLDFQLIFFINNKVYGKVILSMDKSGFRYSYCCTDYEEFPFSISKGWDKYNGKWVSDNKVKPLFVTVANNILNDVNILDEEMLFISR